MKKIHDEPLVVFGPLPGTSYAEMIAEALDKAGIPHILKKDGLSAAYSISGGSLPGNLAYILVPRSLEKQARSIIESLIDHI